MIIILCSLEVNFILILMITLKRISLAVILLLPFLSMAQDPSDFLPGKPGKWTYSNNITAQGAEITTFKNNVCNLAEWFHQEVPMLHSPVGFDLLATTYGQWDKNYQMSKRNYGLRTEMDFSFQLFMSKGGKWTVEPPHYSFNINNSETGHGTNPNYPTFDELKDDPAMEKSFNVAATKMNEVFTVYPFVRTLSPGVNLYDCESGGCGIMVVFNPHRPDFWVPLTLQELADIHLEYYKLRDKTEMDRLLLSQLEKEIAELSAEELNAPAYYGHSEHFVLKANGTKDGLQLMRFNPDYWDKTKPPSTIQFLTFYYPQSNDVQLEESYRNNGHPDYSQRLVNDINWSKLANYLN